MDSCNKTDYLQCACTLPDHVLRISYDRDDGESLPVISFQPAMNPQGSFWRRVVLAVRYVFLKQSFGWSWQYDDVILDEKSIGVLASYILLYGVQKKKMSDSK